LEKAGRAMDTVEKLKYFGLTGHEGTLYLELLSVSRLTGYEAAKRTGISRSNVYTALAGLVEKGAAYVMEEGRVTCYIPVPPEEFFRNRLRKMEHLAGEIIHDLPGSFQEADGYITVSGREKIIDKMRNMIENAAARIYVSAPPDVLDGLRGELEGAIVRHLKVVVIAGPSFRLDGAIIHHTDREDCQIRLITDSARVLTGDLQEGDASSCLYSGRKNLVVLFKEALKNEITLIEMAGREGTDKI